MSAKKTYSVEQSSEEEEPERIKLIIEKAIEEMSNEVTKALALQHPIMYQTYNICEIVGQTKLAKFSIPTLQNICAALELDVGSMTGKRKLNSRIWKLLKALLPGVAVKLVRLTRIGRD